MAIELRLMHIRMLGYQIVSDPALWVSYWKRLATDFAADPLLSKRAMYDILNEPDSRSIK